jgi:hypothetical protein
MLHGLLIFFGGFSLLSIGLFVDHFTLVNRYNELTAKHNDNCRDFHKSLKEAQKILDDQQKRYDKHLASLKREWDYSVLATKHAELFSKLFDDPPLPTRKITLN